MRLNMLGGNLEFSVCDGNVGSYQDDAGFGETQPRYFKECMKGICPALQVWDTARQNAECAPWDGQVWRTSGPEHEPPEPSTNLFIDGRWRPEDFSPPPQPGPSGHVFNVWPPPRVQLGPHGVQRDWQRSQAHGGATQETPLEVKRRKNREAAARCQQRKKLQLEQLRGDVHYLRDLVSQMKQDKHQLQLLEMRRNGDRRLNFPDPAHPSATS